MDNNILLYVQSYLFQYKSVSCPLISTVTNLPLQLSENLFGDLKMISWPLFNHGNTVPFTILKPRG